jgi:general secretion pathway protein L
MALNIAIIQEVSTSAMRWWLAELAELLPQRVRGLKSKDRAVFVALSDERCRIGLREGDADVTVSDAANDPAAIKNQINRISEIRGGPMPIELRLPQDQYFIASNTYPEKVSDKLAQLTALEIERTMPFSVDDVYFSTAIEKNNPDDTIAVTQAFAKKVRIDALLVTAKNLGLSISAIRPEDQNQTLDLLPDAYGAHDRKETLKRRIGISVALVVSLLIFAVTLAGRQERVLARLQEKIAVAKTEAVAAQAAQSVADDAQSQLSRLRDIKQNHPSALQIWEDLSRHLPDSAWLVELKLNKDQVKISGYARAAAPLVNALEAAPSFETVSFAAPVTLDRRVSREKFSITFTDKVNETQIKTTFLGEDAQ